MEPVARFFENKISLLHINSRHLLQEKFLPQISSHFDSSKVQSSFETFMELLLVLQVVSPIH